VQAADPPEQEPVRLEVVGDSRRAAYRLARLPCSPMATEPFGERWTCPRCGRSFAARNQTHACRAGDPPALERHLAGRPAAVVETFWAVVDAARASGPLEVVPERTRVALHARMSFAALIPRRRWLDGHVVLARRLESPRFRRIETFSLRNHLHAFRLTEPEEVDAEVRGWLAEAYEVGMQRHL
jgi:hypothetical protein